MKLKKEPNIAKVTRYVKGRLKGKLRTIKRQGRWEQVLIADPLIKSHLQDCVGIPQSIRCSIVAHVFYESIPTHTDCLARRCYLIPILFTEDTSFYTEYRDTPFKAGHGMRFNDYHPHGITVATPGLNIIVSIDREQ